MSMVTVLLQVSLAHYNLNKKSHHHFQAQYLYRLSESSPLLDQLFLAYECGSPACRSKVS